ncbi:MAG TPA: FAD:protein FMN transferase [Gaiellaceae bacterium]
MTRVEHVMGMPIVVEVDDDASPEVLDRVFGWFEEVDARFSTYKAESEVSRLARGELALEDVHRDVREVLERCAALRDETAGYFDAYASGELDPSGLVKGWAVDRAASILDEAGVRRYAVNAGGDMVVRGGPWRVGIQHPLERDKVAKVVETDELAIATSGEYERGAHVVDPHTRARPLGVLSVTITGPELATADAYATAAFAMGLEGPTWTARLGGGYEAMTILADGRVLSTPGFPAVQ